MPGTFDSMRMKLSGLAASLLLISGFVSAQESVLISNARLVIGDGSVIESGSLLIEDGAISAVGDGAINAPNSVRVIDGSGKTVIPALIDGHAHLGYEAAGDWGGHNYTPETLRDNLEQYAWYGFAAAFSAGSDPDDNGAGVSAYPGRGISGRRTAAVRRGHGLLTGRGRTIPS